MDAPPPDARVCTGGDAAAGSVSVLASAGNGTVEIDNLYANADKTRMGEPIENLEALVGRALPGLEKPENLRGIQGQLWSETVRTGASGIGRGERSLKV